MACSGSQSPVQETSSAQDTATVAAEQATEPVSNDESNKQEEVGA